MLLITVTPLLIALCRMVVPADSAFGKVHFITAHQLSNKKSTYSTGGGSSTALNLDPRVARMVDDELYRERNLDEWKKQRLKNDQAVLESKLPTAFEEADFGEPIFNKQHTRDRKLARDDPQAYCADRCLTTGYCEVFEEDFSFSAVEVIQFCEECVLSDGEEPCDVPAAFLDDDTMQDSSSNLKP